MKNKKHTIKKGVQQGLAFLLFLLLSGIIKAQTPQSKVFEQWSTASSTQNTFIRSVVRSKTLGGTTYYYIAGATLNSGYYDMMVSKMNSSGAILWTQTYSGAGGKDDYATDLQIDAVGNVYVCGSYYKNSTDSNNAIVIKYNNAGTQKWVYTFNGVGSRNDGLSAILAGGNQIFAVGTSWVNSTNKYDILQLRLDSSGTQVWENTWNYATANLNDGATNIYSGAGSLWIGGGVQSSTTNYKYALLKVVPSSGAISSTSVTGGTAMGFDKLTDLKQDINGNIYVTGGVLNITTGYDYKTEKFDSTLNLLWSATYTGSGGSLDDVATGLALDSLSNVIVTGYTNTSTQQKNYATVKYNSSGTQQWVSTFDDTIHGNDSATAIVARGTNIYVTGMSYNGNSYDYCTIKYNSSGTKQWGIFWNSVTNNPDIATAIAIDTTGSVIVTGQTKNSTSNTYMTVKYSEWDFISPNLNSEPQASSFCFIQNRGQLLKTNNTSASEVLYYNKDGNTQQQLYFRADKMSYVFAKYDTASVSPSDTLLRVDVANKNASANCKLGAYNERSDYLNFFLAQFAPDYPTRVKTYNNLVYKNIYNGIDKVVSSNMAGMKYFYVVKHGVNTSQLQEEYTGADSVVMSANKLKIKTKIGTLTYKQPIAWQIDASGTYVSLAWQPTYSITGNVVSFSLGSYDTSKVLVIMMYKDSVNPLISPNPNDNLNWLTHDAGGLNVGTQMNSVKAMNNGESYFASETPPTMYPVSNGFYTATLGSQDGVIIKFNPNASRRWATYMGGSGYDTDYKIALDTIGDVFFLGRTNSTDFTPVGPANSYQQTSSGGLTDWHIGELDSLGTNLIWSTYYGGNGTDYCKDLWVNSDGTKIYAVGNTTSTNFPLCHKNHAYNSTSGWGTIVRFDHLDTTWATQFGTGNELVQEGIQDVYGLLNGVVVVGGLNSGQSEIATMDNGTYYDSTANWDAFISAFNSSDTLFWSTGFGGSNTDGANAVYTKGKNIYVVGVTNPGTGFPFLSTGSEYSDVTVLQNEGWVAHFSSDGLEEWCSAYGGSDVDVLNDVVVDTSKNIYVCGYSQSSNISTQANGTAYVHGQNGTATDAIFAIFNAQHQRIWATYLGGNSAEGAQQIAYSEAGYLYMAGYSNSVASSFPWDFPAGAWIDTAKISTAHAAAYEGRFGLSSINFVGISEHDEQGNNLIAFPNPSSSSITIKLEKAVNGSKLQIRVYDISGRLVKSEEPVLTGDNLQYTMDISTFSTGVYMMEIFADEKPLGRCKFIKQ